MSKIVYILFFFSTICRLQAQSLDNEILATRFKTFSKSHTAIGIFMHSDKNVYTNNEKIWFSIYQLKANDKKEYSPFMNVFLMRSDNRKVVLDQKFRVERDICSGNLTLPDTIAPGNYQLVCFTSALDVKGEPLSKYTQPIIIKNTNVPGFDVRLALVDSTAIDGKLKVKIKVNPVASDSKAKPILQVSYTTGQARERYISSETNELIIPVLRDEVTTINPNLQAAVRYGGNIQHVSLALLMPVNRQIKVRFYPEGGNLSAGLTSLVGWEAKTAQGATVQLEGQLLQDDKLVSTVKTNSLGVGKFMLAAMPGSSYSLKIKAGNYLKSDTIVPLPRILQDGIYMHLNEAVVNDTLRIKLHSLTKKSVQVLIHNYRGDYVLATTTINPAGNKIDLSLNTMPRGLATVTVLDNAGKPLAERLVFCHYDDSTSVNFALAKKVYKTNDSVQIKLSLKDNKGKPILGVFSASVVQESRLMASANDIETAIYLKNELGELPIDPSGVGFRNKAYLEDVLLIRGWRRYTWQELINWKQTDSLQIQVPPVKGQIFLNKKPITSLVDVVVLGSNQLTLVPTSADGAFFLNPQNLFVAADKQIKLSVNKSTRNYLFKIIDPYQDLATALAKRLVIPASRVSQPTANNSEQPAPSLQNTINLQTVKVTASKRNGGAQSFHGEPGVNDCGDYVDEAGHLNYEKSKNRFKPINGRWYTKVTDLQGSYFKVDPIFYTGCLTGSQKEGVFISGIYGGKEYYHAETSAVNIYGSTLYWGSQIKTDANGEAQIKFSTNELADSFKVIVQGITADNMISATQEIKVK
ncbi:hypothetical protein [Mucilaginibacter defluvii]|uniref:MG2 domain-containing protein n=1 Tax=Mucilaginibacter defluvii TaxID=1196019 RepID=A0ABP9FKK4_9SPHI